MQTRSWSLILGTALLVASSLSCRSREETPAGSDTAPVPLTNGTGLDVFPAFSPEGARLAFASDRSGRFEVYVRDLATGKERALTNDGRENVQPVFSPDGKQIVYHSKVRGGLWVLPEAGGEPRLLSDFGSRPSFSPDGSSIVFQSQGLGDLGATSPMAVAPSTLWIVPAKGGPAREVPVDGVTGLGAPRFLDGGREILFVVSDQRLSWAEFWSVPVAGGSPRKLLRQRRLYDPIVSPDGRSVVFGGITGTSSSGVFRASITMEGGTALHDVTLLVRHGHAIARTPAVSPDGKFLLWSSVSTTSNVWSLPIDPASSLPTGAPVPLTSGPGRTTWPLVSPDGKRIAFGRTLPGQNTDIWMIDIDGRNPVVLTSDPGADYVSDWLGGSRLLMTTSSTRHNVPMALDLATLGQKPIGVEAPEISSPRASPNGKELVFHARSGTSALNLWVSPIPGSSPRQLTFDRETIGFPAYSPDGRFVAAQVKRGEDFHVIVVPVAGGNPRMLTSERGLSWPHSFSADGSRIAFAGMRKDLWNLYWVDLAGKVEKLTDLGRVNGYVRYPSWSPKGDRIVFERGETTGNVWQIKLK